MNIANLVAAFKEQRGRSDEAMAALGGLGLARRGRPPKAASTAGR